VLPVAPNESPAGNRNIMDGADLMLRRVSFEDKGKDSGDAPRGERRPGDRQPKGTESVDLRD